VTVIFDILERVLAGLLIAALLGALIGDGGNPTVYLVSAVVLAGLAALVLDEIGSPFASGEADTRRDTEPG
jgi:hypothetical protein